MPGNKGLAERHGISATGAFGLRELVAQECKQSVGKVKGGRNLMKPWKKKAFPEEDKFNVQVWK